MLELRNALAKGVCTAYPLFGMCVTVVQKAVKEPFAQKDAYTRRRPERGGYGLQ